MAISLTSLLKMANFPQEKVNTLMADMDYITEEEKADLALLAWQLITEKYFVLLNLKIRQIWDEVKQGKKPFNKNDIEEAKAALLHELVDKIHEAETGDTIDEIKLQLEKFKTQPLPQG